MLNFLERKAADPSVTEIRFEYTNWRGETSFRTVVPIELWYGKTEWHPAEQWFIRALDIEKNEERDFALTDIRFSRNYD